jgi:magnesium-transporting ATPase (P-type)
MTVIVKTPDNKIKVLCKGADSIIQARLSNSKDNEECQNYTTQHLENYANGGLRTLLLAEKELSEIEYQQFKDEYRLASAAMVKREEKMAEVADKLE